MRLLLIHILFLTWSACFGSIVFICYIVTAGSSSQLVLIFGWTLPVKDILLISLLGNFVICFWINLVFKIFTFDTCFSFDLICLFWVNSVYLLYCFSRKFFSIGIDIKVWYLVEHFLLKMFHWYLLPENFVICFWINLVLKIAFDTYSVFDLICLFGSIVFICYIVSAGSSSQLVLILSLIFGWTLSVKDVSLVSFARKFCNLLLDQFGFWDCYWHMF